MDRGWTEVSGAGLSSEKWTHRLAHILAINITESFFSAWHLDVSVVGQLSKSLSSDIWPVQYILPVRSAALLPIHISIAGRNILQIVNESLHVLLRLHCGPKRTVLHVHQVRAEVLILDVHLSRREGSRP